MMTCREVAASLADDRPLGLMGRLERRLHLMMCRSCRAFDRQMAALRSGVRSLLRRKGPLTHDESQRLEERILRDLDRIRRDAPPAGGSTETEDNRTPRRTP